MKRAEDGCEEFEIAALRQTRGALDSTSASRLAAHVSRCSRCRLFVETARATEAALQEQARSALAHPARAVLRTRLREGRARIARSVLVVGFIVVLECWSRGWTSAILIGGLALLVTLAGIFGHLMPQRRRALAAAAAAEDGELLAQLRKELDRDLDVLRKGRSLRIVLGLLSLVVVAVTGIRLARELWVDSKALAPVNDILPLTLASLLALQLWHAEWCRIPRLERQRKDLA